ncbi:MAG: CocE/NonD family hydrolase [Candidatus Sulfotelmatobacter sp.]
MKIPVNINRTSHVLFASLILACLPLRAQEPHNPEPPKAVHLTWGVKIPMRDGVKLNATVYRPMDQKEALPVIFELTPYISDNYHGRAYYFAQHSYVFALVDVRGRGNSEGQFDPFQQEPQDGHDVVEWLATQPWSNGKVAMWGGSYAGYDQWLTLREFPPHLATIVPAAAAHAGVDFPMFKGIWGAYDMQWLTFTSGVTSQENLFGESSFWIEKFRELYLSHRPYKDLDKIVGDDSTVFQKWIAHAAFDAYWQKLDISPEQYKKINIPILTITGDYDGDQPGAMTYYRDHMKYGTEEAKAKHYLIIGPWDHAGTRTPRKEVGGLTFGDASMLDMNALHVAWYDWTMKNGKPPEFLKKRVAYYVTGAEQWKYADSLEAISNAKRILYLNSSNGEANDAFHSGSLTEAKPGAAKPDQYVYDPLDVRPAELEKEDIKNNITDERYALNLFGDGVVYHSQPFTEDTEISGFVKLVVWMSMDVPDTDFSVNLYEIMPDGKSIQLTGDQIRARYRDSTVTEKLAKPGEIYRYEFSGFTFFSRRIAKGSRLRLVLTSPNSIYTEKNYNSGGVVAEESGKDARTAHVTLYHDGDHPSSLELPLVK